MQSLDKIQATLKTGKEKLSYNGKPLNFSLLDFWRWSVSDILSNATRGIFAEFIVATATNIDPTILREEWSPYDLETPDGIKLEIKSCAYLQTWHQNKLSSITFSIREALYWDSNTSKYSDVAKRHADVYVFCLLHHNNKQTVDPLNLNQWDFYVLPTKHLNEYTKSKLSITLKSLQSLTRAVCYDKLNDEIKIKHALNASTFINHNSVLEIDETVSYKIIEPKQIKNMIENIVETNDLKDLPVGSISKNLSTQNKYVSLLKDKDGIKYFSDRENFALTIKTKTVFVDIEIKPELIVSSIVEMPIEIYTDEQLQFIKKACKSWCKGIYSNIKPKIIRPNTVYEFLIR